MLKLIPKESIGITFSSAVSNALKRFCVTNMLVWVVVWVLHSTFEISSHLIPLWDCEVLYFMVRVGNSKFELVKKENLSLLFFGDCR